MTRLRKADIALPIVTIGGITPENVEGVMRHSACGMLFISVDAQTDKPKKATQAIAQAAWRLTSG